MWRIVVSRRYAGPLVLALVFAITTALLGVWQWSRHTDRLEVVDRIERNYDSAAVPLDDVLPDDAAPATDEEWRRVEVTGTYDPDPLLVRNRPLDNRFGYEVVSILRPDDGGAPVMVDRGWVPNAASAADLPDVPPTPGGAVEVTAWVRQSEQTFGRDLPAGQLDAVSVEQAEAGTGLDLRGGYLILDTETTADGLTPQRPARLAAPSLDLGAHQAYAFQWWLAVPVGFVLVVVKARRDWLDEMEESGGDVVGAAPPRPEDDPDAPVDAEGRAYDGSRGLVLSGTHRDGRPKPKKVRIWDEEDE